MKHKTAKAIARIWNRLEKREPDISTERLMEMTSQEASKLFGRGIDNGDVGEALYTLQKKKKTSTAGQCPQPSPQ